MSNRHVSALNAEYFTQSEHAGRASMPMSDGWKRFHPVEERIWIDDAEGRPRGLTPKQYAVLVAVFDVIASGEHPTMTAIGGRLGYAVSTVSRTLTKLAAWGLIRYISGRGRYAGLLIFRAVKGDGLERLRKEAKARLRRWYQAAQDRISRTKFNVAPMKPTTTYGVYTGSGTSTVTGNVIGATLKAWTPDELRDMGII